jgi:co-chaperonin GroES (HSP10)
MRALNDRVLVKMANMPEKTEGGIIMPDRVLRDGQAKINIGKVLAVGGGITLRTGEVIPVRARVGEVVVWEQYGGVLFEILGKGIMCIRSEDIGAILEPGEYQDTWFSDEVEAQNVQNNLDAFEKQRKKLREVVETKCERICAECGFEGSDEDHKNIWSICPKCEKESFKTKNPKMIGHVSGGTPMFH